MATPFIRISGEVQEEHSLYGQDTLNLAYLSTSQDPRVTEYCKLLHAHKARCPICSWPRLYPFIRRVVQLSRRVFMRKLW
jgi:hypothetical protein